MEAECIKSLFLLVPIMSHDEHNYPTAPPIHQSKDGAQCRWSEWGTGYFGSEVWRDWGVGWLKMHTFQHHHFNMCIWFLTYWFSGSILEICAWWSTWTRSKNSNLLRWSRWTEWATFNCWQFNSPGSCQQQQQQQKQKKKCCTIYPGSILTYPWHFQTRAVWLCVLQTLTSCGLFVSELIEPSANGHSQTRTKQKLNDAWVGLWTNVLVLSVTPPRRFMEMPHKWHVNSLNQYIDLMSYCLIYEI